MEEREEQLVSRVLGKDFLKAAKRYGEDMKAFCAANGAGYNVQDAMRRIAEIAFVKGAEYYRRTQWHELGKKYPKLEAWMLFRGESGYLFFGKIVKKNGSLEIIGEDGQKAEKVTHWMELPNVEDVK